MHDHITKKEFIKQIAETAECSLAFATKIVDAYHSVVTNALAQDKSVKLVGFGTYYNINTKKRVGRNPRTGEAIQVASKKSPRFSAGTILKAAVNNK